MTTTSISSPYAVIEKHSAITYDLYWSRSETNSEKYNHKNEIMKCVSKSIAFGEQLSDLFRIGLIKMKYETLKPYTVYSVIQLFEAECSAN